MRLPFDLNDSQFMSDARIKFSYTAPELNQNIEISIDGDKVSVEALLETYERFLGALGVCIPNNVVLGFIETDEEGDEEDDEEQDGPISFTLEDPEENDDQDGEDDGKKNNRRKKK